MNELAKLRALGFDKSQHIPFTKSYRVGCSQCEAVSINGRACHEAGCLNLVFECQGCTTLVGRSGGYCADCR